MGRFLLLILVAVLALASPVVRSRLQPYLRPALDPVYEWSARSKVRELARLIESDRTAGKPSPKPREFSAFIRRHYGDEGAGVDPWGVPFYLKRNRGTLVVASAGRDGTRGTADDIRETAVAPARRALR